jgi:hypothetical protein
VVLLTLERGTSPQRLIRACHIVSPPVRLQFSSAEQTDTDKPRLRKEIRPRDEGNKSRPCFYSLQHFRIEPQPLSSTRCVLISTRNQSRMLLTRSKVLQVQILFPLHQGNFSVPARRTETGPAHHTWAAPRLSDRPSRAWNRRRRSRGPPSPRPLDAWPGSRLQKSTGMLARKLHRRFPMKTVLILMEGTCGGFS